MAGILSFFFLIPHYINDDTNRRGTPLARIERTPLARGVPAKCKELLKETYGYDGFRNLEIYDDLFKNRDTLCISQGQLVENVIREAEKAYKGGEQPDNILLTAPTGAGKSLLFQLPAIYLGKEYNLLTIVVSPLKALIVDQVEGLQDVGYERVAYASSDLSPEQKMEVYRAVREGEIDLFYLSRSCCSPTTSDILSATAASVWLLSMRRIR